MRRLLLIILLATGLAGTIGLSAQTYLLDRPLLYIGTSHGATASMVLFNPNVQQDILLGYNGGLTVRYVAERGMGIQAELNFSQRGWAEHGGLYTRSLSYVEVPLLMNLTWGKTFRFLFNLGPKASYLIGDRVTTDLLPETEHNARHRAIDHRFDYGVALGLGMEVAFGRQSFQLEARANYSLNTLFAGKMSYDLSNHMNLALNLVWMMQVNK